jgi:hypothetical protein
LQGCSLQVLIARLSRISRISDDNLLGDGFDVISIQLRVTGTFQENNGTLGQVFSVLYSSTNTLGALNLGDPSCTATDITNVNLQALGACVNTTGVLAIAPTDVINPFSVTVFGGASSNPLPFNASASIFYQVVTNQQSSVVPEPSTCMLLSLGFLAFAFIRRK